MYYILLLRHSLLLYYYFLEANFAIVITWLLSWLKRSLVALKLLNWSWIQPWWCGRNQMMLIYLIVTSSGAKQCTWFSLIFMILFGNYAIFPSILSLPKCQFTEDGPGGNVWHVWWTFLRGRLGNVNGMSQEEYFINRWKLCDCDLFIYLFVSLAYTFKRHE